MRSISIFLVALATSCYGGSLPPNMIANIDARLDRIAKDEGDHFSTMQTMQSKESAVALEDLHRETTDADYKALADDLSHVSMCKAVNGGGGADPTSGFHDELQDVRAEWDRHDSRVRLASDMPSILGEERRHQAAMTDAIATLRLRRDDLAALGGMSCP